MAEAPDGRLFYNELKTGNVRIIENGKLQEGPFATVGVATIGESGLLGLALDPDFPENHYVYILRTVPDSVTGRPMKQEVIRFTDDQGKGVDPSVIVEDLPATKNSVHNGGRLEFGPDEKLWITIGDGDPDPGTLLNSYDPSSYYGKVLRFNRDGSIPADNPVPNSPVYAMGFRNPFGMAFHPTTGSLFVSENGPTDSDEINVVVPSGNYGWPFVRGIANQPRRYVDPVYVWHQSIAPTGVAFHPGDPNTLFVCSAISGELRALTLGADFKSVVSEEPIARGCHLDVEVSNNGNLYISGFDSIRRVQLQAGP
jgi:glucose/arabinose dehydrogenase